MNRRQISARIHRVAVIVSLMLFTAHVAPSQTPNGDPRSKCPETPAPQPPFTPKGASPQRGGPGGYFFFGTPKLSVLLNRPWFVQQTSVRWFSDDVPTPVTLKVTGRRLDPDVHFAAFGENAPVPKFSFGPSGGGRGNLILSSMEFPTPGCWEITARMNDTELRFVTYVEQKPK